MNSEDKKLVISCQDGNVDSFGKLYDKYIKKIYDFIYYKVGSREVAEDLTQQTFLKALRKIENFNASHGYFSAWVYKIARNSVIDHYRTAKYNSNIEDMWDLGSKENVEIDIHNKLKIENVRKYLNKLKPEQRELVVMRVWQGLTYKEISEILGKSESSCKMMFSRVIGKLRKKMPAHVLALLLLNI